MLRRVSISWVSACVLVRSHLCACVMLGVLAWLSRADPCFNEAAETWTHCYSRAQHYSWPISLSLLLWELLDSFPILWSCILCACQSLFMRLWCSVLCIEPFFPLSLMKRKRLIPQMWDESHLHPLLSSVPSFDRPGLLWILSHTSKYDTSEEHSNACTHIKYSTPLCIGRSVHYFFSEV